jgi:hypothetical protein
VGIIYLAYRGAGFRNCRGLPIWGKRASCAKASSRGMKKAIGGFRVIPANKDRLLGQVAGDLRPFDHSPAHPVLRWPSSRLTSSAWRWQSS